MEGSRARPLAAIDLPSAHTLAPAVTQSQIAATVAAFLGKDYRQDVPTAAPALTDVLSSAPNRAGSR